MTGKETILATCLLILFGTSMHFVHQVPLVQLANRWRKSDVVRRYWPLWIKDYLFANGFVWSEDQLQFRPIGYDI